MEDRLWLFVIHRRLLATAAETDGGHDVIEAYMPEGLEMPVHIHPEYVEMVCVTQGALSVRTDKEKIVLKAGQNYNISKGQPHALSATSDGPAKVIAVFSPSGFAEIIRIVDIPGDLADGEPAVTVDIALFERLSEAIGDVTLGRPGIKIKLHEKQ